MSDTFYIIINETTFRATDNISTEVLPEGYTSLQRAVDFIHELADEYGVYVEDDADSVYLPPSAEYITSDEYYIAEVSISE